MGSTANGVFSTNLPPEYFSAKAVDFGFCLLLEEKVPHGRMAAADEVLF